MVAEILPNTNAGVFMICLFYWYGQNRFISWVKYVFMVHWNVCWHIWAAAHLWRQFNYIHILITPGGYIGLYSLELAWLSLQRVAWCCRIQCGSLWFQASVQISVIFLLFVSLTLSDSCDSIQEIRSQSEFVLLGPLQALQHWAIHLYSQWEDAMFCIFY